MSFYYSFNCVESDCDTITGIVDRSTQITHKEIETALGSLLLCSFSRQVLGYDDHLKMQDDYAVSYYRSTYDYKPCYYVRWSAIEYVFLQRPAMREAS